MTAFTARDKCRCAEREIVQRLRVYPRLISENKMTTKQADRQIGIMKEIAEDYRVLAEAEEAKERLL